MEIFAKPLLNPDLPPPAGLKAWNGSDPATRYAVYRNNVVQSLIDALADTFPVVQQLVGKVFFHAMAGGFVRQSPPTSPVLAHYGEQFADFVARFAPAFPLPYLADVARLEWAYVSAFHAADVSALPAHILAERLAQPERLAATCLRFAPHVRLIRSDFAVVSLWHAHQTDAELSAIDWSQAEAALVVRPELEVQVIPLACSTADLLQALLAGHSLGTAYECCTQQCNLDMRAIFSLLLDTHALAALTTEC